jgi:hypothetical protein
MNKQCGAADDVLRLPTVVHVAAAGTHPPGSIDTAMLRAPCSLQHNPGSVHSVTHHWAPEIQG